jgi:hypothetical protein
VVPFKVRRRAQAVRLAAQGWTAPRIARHLGLDRTTLHRDLRRWPERGIEGLGQRSYLEPTFRTPLTPGGNIAVPPVGPTFRTPLTVV